MNGLHPKDKRRPTGMHDDADQQPPLIPGSPEPDTKAPGRQAGQAAGDSTAPPPKLTDGVTVQQHILDTVRKEYFHPDHGLAAMFEELKLRTRPPREKVTVLIIGNHSAGKSSFINWYIDEYVQKESVAMETSGFVFVTSGARRDTLKGRATQRHIDFLEGFEKFENGLNNLSTEVCTSKARRFGNVDFIDSPGLTDGQLRYPFDVNAIVEWLAPHVDLVFVFFDPHGQATCERTMAVVKKLNSLCRKKVQYFLTRADEIPTEKERSKVMVQLSQNLSRAVDNAEKYYGEHALEVKTIFRPNLPGEMADFEAKREKDASVSAAFNQIYDTVDLIDQTIKENVQRHCESLERDAVTIANELDLALSKDTAATAFNTKATLLRAVLFYAAVLIPVSLICYLIRFASSASISASDEFKVPLLVFHRLLQTLSLLGVYAAQSPHRYELLGFFIGAFFALLLLAALLGWLRKNVRASSNVAQLRAWRKHLDALSDKKTGLVQQMWELYLKNSTDSRKKYDQRVS